jgi:hypothetical protein
MPLGRKHLRRSRDAPTGGMGLQRTASILRRKCREVKCPWGSLYHTCFENTTLLWTRARLWAGIRSAIDRDRCIERSRRDKALAKRNRNRGRRRALTTAGDQYRCHCYVDNSFDNQWDVPSAKGHEMASTQLATRRVQHGKLPFSCVRNPQQAGGNHDLDCAEYGRTSMRRSPSCPSLAFVNKLSNSCHFMSRNMSIT